MKHVRRNILDDERLHMEVLRRNALIRQKFRCWFCFSPLLHKGSTGDHLVPRSRGGRTIYENIVAACRRCNLYKANRSVREFIAYVTNPPVSAPIEIWDIHISRRIWRRTWTACARIERAVGMQEVRTA